MPARLGAAVRPAAFPLTRVRDVSLPGRATRFDYQSIDERSRRLYLAHLGAHYVDGVYRRGGTTMHVSPGLGTTFVPFRFFARPEATELVLRRR